MDMTKKQKKMLVRILVTAAMLIVLHFVPEDGPLRGVPLFLLYLVPYGIIGYDILKKAWKGILHRQVFDENFLMAVATVGALAIGLLKTGDYVEAVAVMLFYQVGELFQDHAVGKSREAIAAMMDIVPEYANVEQNGEVTQMDPDEVEVGSTIVIMPGERVPLDGKVISGESWLDTAALTGESVPRRASEGDDIYSGSVNGSGTLRVVTSKAYEDSTVARILTLVEEATDKKAKTEQFITKFARYYTPFVTIAAALLAIVPPLFIGGGWAVWSEWIRRACVFLVISCPCALVISVPLGFFGGIGAASKIGVLVKGSTCIESIARMDTLVFDKTGTLTKGEFKVASVRVFEGGKFEEVSSEDIRENSAASHILRCAAYAEKYSTHPVGEAIRTAYAETLDLHEVDAEEIAGQGISAMLDDRISVLAGNAKLLRSRSIEPVLIESPGTVVYVAENGKLTGAVLIEDSVKDGTREGLEAIRAAGVAKTVMLTGDRTHAATLIAEETGIDEVRAELLPGDKVSAVEALIAEAGPKGSVAYVGDGINDAPVLMRADVGIAMGAIGSDAAIEAADIVLMDDDLRKIGKTISIARKTLRIVYENIVFALAVKLIVLILGALGLAPIWLAIFADVGVAVLCVLNSMRCLRA